MKADSNLDRLLRSAAKAEEPAAPEAPYGFATRVVAMWRAVALAVVALASAGAYSQFSENEQRSAPQTNEYAIADSAIQTEFSQ